VDLRTVSVFRSIVFKSATVNVSVVETAPLTFIPAALGAAVCAKAGMPAAKIRARAMAAKRHKGAEVLSGTVA
jgi:hypothetical protein